MFLLRFNYFQICDFGFAGWMAFSQSHSKEKVRRGTVTHIPPENWTDPYLRKTEKFDVYSFAILTYETFTGKRAFGDGLCIWYLRHPLMYVIHVTVICQ